MKLEQFDDYVKILNDNEVTLDGTFTIEQLEEIIEIMREQEQEGGES